MGQHIFVVMKFSSTISFIVLFMTNIFAFGQDGKNDSTSRSVILFICEHGAAKSAIATAYFNKLSKEKALNYKAIFRGINPDTSLSSGAKKGLLLDGFDIKDWKPQLITQHDINNAVEIITLGCDSSITLEKHVHAWNGIPPVSKDYQEARNQIVDKVTIFIKELEQRQPGKK